MEHYCFIHFIFLDVFSLLFNSTYAEEGYRILPNPQVKDSENRIEPRGSSESLSIKLNFDAEGN